jgi:dTDP-4-amino-4,6-dideoxy-D-galactose acyltransferase
VAAGRVLEWDSEFWGVRIAQVDGPDVEDWASAHGVACAYLLVPSSEIATAHRTEDGGFRLMDVRVELEADAVASGADVRAARDEDVPTLRTIARTNHADTRFYADPRFPRDGCDELYDTWIRRSCEGWADAVFVVDGETAAAGYLSVHRRDDHGSIGLIGVDSTARGRGLGDALVRGALDWCAAEGLPTCRVVTQGGNVAAQRVFQRCGFRTRSVDLWFHKWFDE